MSFNLHSINDIPRRFNCPAGVYDDLLNIAQNYGWQPMGTRYNTDFYVVLYPEIPLTEHQKIASYWQGGYFTNDKQIVTAEDASNLATALEKSLNDLSDAAKSWVTEFTEFCKAGSFDIW